MRWLCDHFQYFGLAKPMYCLMGKKHNRANVEQMFQFCLIYACGYTAAAWSLDYQDLYDAYLPLIEMLADRRWVFDPDPLTLPTGFEGNIFRGREGDILVTLVKTQTSAIPEKEDMNVVSVRTRDIGRVKKVELWTAGDNNARSVEWERDSHKLSVHLPADIKAAGILKMDVA